MVAIRKQCDVLELIDNIGKKLIGALVFIFSLQLIKMSVCLKTVVDAEIGPFCKDCLINMYNVSLPVARWNIENYKRRLIPWIPDVHLDFASYIRMCYNCIAMLDHFYEFKMKCLQVDKNIKECLRTHGVIDLRDLSI